MSATGYKLFLIEFIPDTVVIPSMKAISKKILPVKTVISLSMLDLPDMNIEHSDMIDNCMCFECDTHTFQSGKSCLFAIESHIVESPVTSFTVKVTVKKLLPFDTLPDVIIVGTRMLQLKELLNAVLNDVKNCVDKPNREIEDTFEIENDNCEKVGEVKMLIRISWLGPKIVTQFTMPSEDKSYYFKANANSPILEFKTVPVCEKTDQSNLDCNENELDQDNVKSKLCFQPPANNKRPCK